MPNWKKLIVSGSDATLNSINVITTGSFGSAISFINVDGDDRIRLFNSANTGHSKLEFQNNENDLIAFISSSGNVGIGTATSSQKLRVQGNFRVSSGYALIINDASPTEYIYLQPTDKAIQLSVTSSNTTYDPQFLIRQDGAVKAQFGWDDDVDASGSLFINNASGGAIRFLTGSGNNDVAAIIASGSNYLGLGETDPDHRLHLSGSNVNIKLEGTGAGGAPITSIFMYRAGVKWSLLSGTGGANRFDIRDDANSASRFTLNSAGKLTLGAYGSGTHTGTGAYNLQVDSSGNVIESAIAGGTVDGTGAANKLAIWSDTDTLTNDTNLHWDTSNDRLGIGSTSPGTTLDVLGSFKAVNGAGGDTITTFQVNTHGNVIISRNHATSPQINSTFSSGNSTLNFTRSSQTFTKIECDNSYFSGSLAIGKKTHTSSLDVVGDISIDGESSGIIFNKLTGFNQVYSIKSNSGNLAISKDGTDGGGSIKFLDENDRVPLEISMGLVSPEVDVRGEFRVKNRGATSMSLQVLDGASGIGDTIIYGDLGLGTTSPSERLHVSGNVAISGANATLQMREGSAELYKFTAGGTSLDMTVDGTNALSIFQNGRVGIATASPSTDFHVNGEQLIKKVDTSTAHHGTLNIKANVVAANSNHARSAFINLQGAAVSSNSITNYDFVLGTHHTGDFIVARDNSFAGGYDSASLKIDKNDLTVTVENALNIGSVANAPVDVDKFLVLSGSSVQYRSGSQLLSDIGGQASGNFVTLDTSQTIAASKVFSGDITLDKGATASPNLAFINGNDTRFNVVGNANDTFQITKQGNNGADFLLTGGSSYTGSFITVAGLSTFGYNSVISGSLQVKDDIIVYTTGSGRYIQIDHSDDSLKLADNNRIKLGTGNDLQIVHDGNNSFIQDTGTGNLFIEAQSSVMFRKYNTAEFMAKFINDGAVELYHDNSKKLETTSSGVNVTGDMVVSGNITAQEFHTEFVSASIIYESGSTKFGDTQDDLHSFTGSLEVKSGSVRLETFQKGLEFFNGSDYTSNRIKLTSAQNMQFVAGGSFQFTPSSTFQILAGKQLQLNNSNNSDSIKIHNSSTDDARLDIEDGSNNVLMAVSSSGKVGIGTETPNRLLQVKDTSGTAAVAITSANTGTAQLELGGTSDNDIAGISYNGSTQKLFLKTNNTGQLYVDNSGNVSIGTDSPSAKLDLVDSQTQAGSTGIPTIKSTATTTATSTQNTGMYKIQNFFNLTGTGGSFANAAHHQVMTTVSSTGTSTNLKNHMSRVHTSGNGQISTVAHYNTHAELDGNGTIANWIGYAVAHGTLSQFTNTGHTITNTYGLYIGDITSGTQTNTPYGVYQLNTDMRNYFAGKVGIGAGSSNPSPTLQVGNAAYAGGQLSVAEGSSNNRVARFENIEIVANAQGGTYTGQSLHSEGTNRTLRFTAGGSLNASDTSAHIIKGFLNNSRTVDYTTLHISGGYNNNTLESDYNFVQITGAVTQTSLNQSGSVTGIYYNPTFTNLTGSHTAFRATSGDVKIDSGNITIGSGSTDNYSLRLTRTNSGVVQESQFYSPTNNSPSAFFIEGGKFTAEAAGTSSAANNGYPYYERYFGNGSSNSYKHFGFVNSSGSFTNTHLTASLVLKADGNVGIGTTGPGCTLHVYSQRSGTKKILVEAADNNQAGIDFKNTTNHIRLIADTNHAFFRIYDQGGTTNRFQISGSGQIRGYQYGSGNFTGTAAYNLSVDSSGRIIETSTSSGGAVSAVTNGANDRVATFTSATALNGESGLTYSSTTGMLKVQSAANAIVELHGGAAEHGTLKFKSASIDSVTMGYHQQGYFMNGANSVNPNGAFFMRGDLGLDFGSNNTGSLSIRSGSANHRPDVIIDSKVRLGVGTNNPAEVVHVEGNIQANNLKVTDKIIHKGDSHTFIEFTSDNINFDTSGSTALTINSSQRVGVGTTSPQQPLHVQGNFLQSGSNYNITISDGSTIGGSNHLLLLASTSYVQLRSSNNFMYLDAASGFRFRNGNGSTDLAAIDSTGSLGVGTNVITEKLTVSGSVSASGDVHLANLQFDHFNGDIHFGTNSTANKLSYNAWQQSASGGTTINNTAGTINFDSKGQADVLVISGSSIGINTNNPQYATLQVTGTGLFSSNLQVQGTLNLRGNTQHLNHDSSAFVTTLTRYTGGSELGLDFDYVRSINATSGSSVGIGTLTPAKSLHVYHATSNEVIRVESGDAGAFIQFKDNSSSPTMPVAGASGENFVIRTSGSESFKVQKTGKTTLNNYGSGTFTGTAVKTLQVDSSGNIIEGSVTNFAPKVEYQAVTSDIAANATFTLPNSLSYTVSSGGYEYLEVFLDGIRLNRGIDFEEISTTSIRTLISIPSGSVFTYKSIT